MREGLRRNARRSTRLGTFSGVSAVCTQKVNTPPYLTRIEGPPPKRNVARSSRAGGARTLEIVVFPALFCLLGAWGFRSPGRWRILRFGRPDGKQVWKSPCKYVILKPDKAAGPKE